MKRKTNLFYLSGDDSNFLTFSNYTESLTGNFIATDAKLFPSKFICMNITKLNEGDNKKAFISNLTEYYENKLAVLRDYCLENNKNVEQNILPLQYLLETIVDESNENEEYNGKGKITFIGDITEQDYNGIHTDIITVINSSDYAKEYTIKRDFSIDKVKVKVSDTYLHGWESKNTSGRINNTLEKTEYYNLIPKFDESNISDNYYVMNSQIVELVGKELINQNIEFNIIIPLYDFVCIADKNNTLTPEPNTNNIKFDNDTNYLKNVPLGIWISDTVIELKRDTKTHYAPSWSLLISSQFKPFPYSHKIENIITQDTSKEAFATYSQILLRQNALLKKFEESVNKYEILANKITDLEAKLNVVGSAYYSDVLRKELYQFENYQQTQMNKFKDEIYSYVLTKWKGYIS